MGMVAPPQRIASAYTVHCGRYGDGTRLAQERGVCRQWLYREAHWVAATLAGKTWRQANAGLRTRVRELEQQLAVAQQRLARSVELTDDKQAELARVGQASGVSLPEGRVLLEVLTPGHRLSVATLGRRTEAAGKQAGRLLHVFDEFARTRTRQAAADESYVKAPVLRTVEPDSLCWLGGRRADAVTGAAWAEEFRQLPNLEQVTRAGGRALAKGVAVVNDERDEQQQPRVVDQADHFHAFRDGGRAVRQAAVRAQQALTAAEAVQRELDQVARRGQKRTGPSARARTAWRRAEQAMAAWSAQERGWEQTKQAFRLFTPAGELNTPARVALVLAETVPQLPDKALAKVQRPLPEPDMVNYLTQAERPVAALPFPAEVKQAAVQHEGLRRQPELLQGTEPQAAGRRGLLLACAVVLAQAGPAGQQAAAAVRDSCRRADRASSLVECLNSVLRMQQARHRKWTQGMIDLKRLYWNGHTFRTGRRRGTTPYQRLGVPWPESLSWWEVVKLTPEQLRERLSTAKKPE